MVTVLHVTKSEDQMMRKDNTTGRRSREAIFHKDIMFSSLVDFRRIFAVCGR
jgi:hypothetical protein